MMSFSIADVLPLDGKIYAMLPDEEIERLNLLVKQGRKNGVTVLLADQKEADLSDEAIERLRRETNARVQLKISKPPRGD